MDEREQSGEGVGRACRLPGHCGRTSSRKDPCPDCFQCQGCSEDRCRICRKEGHSAAPTLSTGFTLAEYTAWKTERDKKCGDGSRSST